MIQQVNLYQDCVKPGVHTPLLNTYTGSLAAAALIGTAFSLYLFWTLHSAEQQLQLAKQNLSSEQTRVAQLLANQPKQALDPLLAQQVKQLQTATAELKLTLQLLADNSASGAEGFSKYFQAFGNQAIPEVWLSSVYIDEQKHIIDLQGSTFQANKIAYFLQRLQNEPIFHGQSFAKLTLQKSATLTEQLDFSISTHIEPLPDHDHVQ